MWYMLVNDDSYVCVCPDCALSDAHGDARAIATPDTACADCGVVPAPFGRRPPPCPPRVREQSLVWFGAPLSLTPSAALLADI